MAALPFKQSPALPPPLPSGCRQYVFDANSTWDRISASARDFVARLLALDPRDRPSAAAALRHAWLQSSGSPVSARRQTALRTSLSGLRLLNAKTKFERDVEHIRAEYEGGMRRPGHRWGPDEGKAAEEEDEEEMWVWPWPLLSATAPPPPHHHYRDGGLLLPTWHRPGGGGRPPVVKSPCRENDPPDTHPSAHKSVLESANPRTDSECASGCPWSTARATAPSPGRPTPGVVKQDKSSGGCVDTTKTRSDPQRVRMSSGEGPMGAAKGEQSDTEALCPPPPPQMLAAGWLLSCPRGCACQEH